MEVRGGGKRGQRSPPYELLLLFFPPSPPLNPPPLTAIDTSFNATIRCYVYIDNIQPNPPPPLASSIRTGLICINLHKIYWRCRGMSLSATRRAISSSFSTLPGSISLNFIEFQSSVIFFFVCLLVCFFFFFWLLLFCFVVVTLMATSQSPSASVCSSRGH